MRTDLFRHHAHVLVHNLAEFFIHRTLIEDAKHLENVELGNFSVAICVEDVECKLHEEVVIYDYLLKLLDVLPFVDVARVVEDLV